MSDVNGIELKPIRLRNSLYLLIPMDIAKLIGVTDRTRFMLTLRRDEECVLSYQKTEAHEGGVGSHFDPHAVLDEITGL